MSILKLNLYILVIMASFQSCNSQSRNIEVCKNNYDEAKSSLNLFYTNNDHKLLSKSLEKVEQSLDCPETRKASIELKINILSLQKEYIKAYNFVNSLNKEDFSKSYKRSMQANLFMGLNYESKMDDVQKVYFYNQGINEIEKYIITNKNFDEEAYYDLFLLKSKVLAKDRFDEEIKSLISKNPSQKDFFSLLYETFDNGPKKSEIVRD